MSNMYNLCCNNTILLKSTLINIDGITINYSDVLEMNNNKYYIVSDRNLTKEKPWKEKILYLDDKKFFDILTREDKKQEKPKYLDSLKSAYITLLNKDIYLIKKHPIFNMIRNSNKYIKDHDIKNFDAKILQEKEIIRIVHGFYNNQNYKKFRDLYLILKSNKALYKEHRYKTEKPKEEKYYLYLKDYSILKDKDNFFKDKILVMEGTLEEIDKFTTKFNNIEEIGLNSFGINKQIILTGEGVIISSNTRSILERKLDKKTIFYPVLTKEDNIFYESMNSFPSAINNYFDSLRSSYLFCLLEDEKTVNEFINYYGKEMNQDLSDLNYSELVVFLNKKTKDIDYTKARYMYTEIKKSEERRRKKNKNERNRKLH